MAEKDVSYAAWVAAGSPGFSYDDWRWWQTGDTSDRKSEGDTHSPAYMRAHGNDPDKTVSGSTASPLSFEQLLAGGEFAGKEAEATQLEVRRRRNLLTDYHDMKDLPPDVADIVLRDSSGKVRKARSATTQSALGAAFDSKASLFGER